MVIAMRRPKFDDIESDDIEAPFAALAGHALRDRSMRR
jgi:hypothetical protein